MSREVQTIKTPSALAEQIRSIKPHLERLVDDPRRFATALVVAGKQNEKILQCEPSSVIGAALTCAQLDLMPGPAQHVALIPRWNKTLRVNELTVLPMYRGLQTCMERHPDVVSVQSGIVHRNDQFRYTQQPPDLEHTPALEGDRGEAYLWYAVAYMTGERPPIIEVLTRDDVEHRRAQSEFPDGFAWKKHFNAMGRKSAIRALASRTPSSLDVVRVASMAEGAVVRPDELGVGAEDPAAETDDAGATVDVELVDENGEPMIRGRVATDTEDSHGEGDGARAVASASKGDPPAEPTGGGRSGEDGNSESSSPETTLADGGADDRQILAIITLQKQRGHDDHDLAELIRDRFDLEADDLDGLLNLLDEDQAGSLIAELQATGDGDGGGQ